MKEEVKKKSKLGKMKFEILIVIFAVVFLVSSILFKIFGLSDIWSQLIGTLLGTIITAIVTVLLLKAQTDREIGHDKDVGIFEKKQEVYYDFLRELEKISQDGKINVPGIDDYDETKEDELQHLIYQLGLVQMHASTTTAEEITEKTGVLLSNLTLIGKDMEKKNEVYSNLAEGIFNIVSLLKKDLYGTEYNPVSKDKFKNAIRASGAFDSELLSQEGRSNELKVFLEFLKRYLEEAKITSHNVFISYRDLTEKDGLDRIARGYISVKTDRWIKISVRIKDNCNFLIEFDDHGSFWVEFKDDQEKNLDNLNNQYKELEPKDPDICFLNQSGSYKQFARLTEEGKNLYVRNYVEGIQKKLNTIFSNEE